MTILRLRHSCGRNLADVTPRAASTRDDGGDFTVTARPGVPMRLWWPPGSLPTWDQVTYVFDCPGPPGRRCESSIEVRAHQFFNAWSQRQQDPGRVAVWILY